MVLHDSAIQTTEQQKAYLMLTTLQATRWPVAPLERLTPYDEEAYRNILQFASTHLDGQNFAFSRSLMTTLLEDGPYLDPDLVRNLVSLVLKCAGGTVESHDLAVLAFRCPYLLDDDGFVEILAEPDTPNSALTHLILQRFEAQSQHPVTRILAARFAQSPQTMAINNLSATPEMVRAFAGSGVKDRFVAELLTQLTRFGDLAWSRVEPTDLMDLIRERFNVGIEPVDEYLAYRRSIGTAEEELAGLVSWLDERTGKGEG
jgi:hypothetical protein